MGPLKSTCKGFALHTALSAVDKIVPLEKVITGRDKKGQGRYGSAPNNWPLNTGPRKRGFWLGEKGA